MKIDIRGLKRIGGDKNSTHFQTKKGHTFIVKHDSLNKGELGALNAISSSYKENDAPDYSNVSAQAASPVEMAQGGGIGGQEQPMWHGVKNRIYGWSGRPQQAQDLPQSVKTPGAPGENTSPYRPVNLDNPDDAPPSPPEVVTDPAPVPEMARGGMVRRYADGTPNAPVDNEPDDAAQDRLDSAKKIGVAKYLPAIDAAPVPSNQADASTQGAIGPPSVGGQGYAVPRGMEDLAQGYQTQLGGVQKQAQAAQMGAQAQGQLGQEEATSYGAGINQLNNLNNSFQQHYQNIQNERQSLMREMQAGAQHLDPQAFIKNMSTGGRIMTGIGLVLGGMGAGMTHGPNLAADFLQRNIDRDIDNQRAQLGVKNNLLKFNFDNSKDLQDALAFSKLNTMDMVSMYLKRQGAQAQNPLQQAAALNTAGQLDEKAGQIQAQIAQQRTLRQVMMGSQGQSPESQFQAQNNGLRAMGPEGEKLATSREQHHIPGLPGQSSIPVPGSAQDSWQEMQNLQKTFQDAQDYMGKVGSTGAWSPELYAEGQGIKERMATSVRKLEDAKRLNPYITANFKGMVPDLTGTHFTGLDQGKINAGMQELENQMKTFKAGYGYDQNAQTPQDKAPKQSSANEVERLTKDNKIAIYDGKSKKFLRWK